MMCVVWQCVERIYIVGMYVERMYVVTVYREGGVLRQRWEGV